eukprot:3661859-Pleurochrysis_carterae.AAC.2
MSTRTATPLPATVKPGVVSGQALVDLLQHAKENKYAIPAVNVVSSCSITACLEAAAKYGGPIIVQFSRGGGQFIAGKKAKNDNDAACIAGTVAHLDQAILMPRNFVDQFAMVCLHDLTHSAASCVRVCLQGALHVRQVAELYGVPVILHTDHCMRSWLPWFDGLMEANEKHFELHGEPLFSSHMLDLSEEPLEENIATCKEYLERMAKFNCLLEMELGVTGGEEDGVDNTDVDSSRLYTQPEEVWEVYKALSEVEGGAFTIAAAFGNVHGVYAPGNVDLRPDILHNTQKYVAEKLGGDDPLPCLFVFHGGSGSSVEDIRYAIDAGTIKMNIDTDTQWAFWDGIRQYEAKYHDYLQAQIGNPEGETKPNKKYYDPRMALRSGEEVMRDRLCQAADDLNCVNVVPVL